MGHKDKMLAILQNQKSEIQKISKKKVQKKTKKITPKKNTNKSRAVPKNAKNTNRDPKRITKQRSAKTKIQMKTDAQRYQYNAYMNAKKIYTKQISEKTKNKFEKH